jgi:hypothetical protein
MARRPNYSFEKRERERRKTEKRNLRIEERAERAKLKKSPEQDLSEELDGEGTPEDTSQPATD